MSYLLLGIDGVNKTPTEYFLGVDGVNRRVTKLLLGVDGVNQVVYEYANDPNAKYYFLEDSEQFVLQDSEGNWLKPRWVNQLQDIDLKLLEDEVGLDLIAVGEWKLKDGAIFYIKDKDGNFIGTKEV